MKFNDTLTEIIKLDLEVGAVPALMGEPGIGKSSFMEALAESMGTKAFVLPCNQLADKADLTGARLVPYEHNGETKYKQVFFPHQVVQDAIDYAEANPREWPILFLDEINRSSSDVTSAALSLPTQRKIGSVDLPKNLRLAVAGNDKGNITALDEASISRFAIYHVEPDALTLVNLIGSEMNPWVKNVLTKHPNLVFQKSAPSALLVDGDDDDPNGTTVSYADLLDSGEEMLQLTTPRTIAGVSRWLNAVTLDKLIEYMQTSTTINGRETTVLNEIIEAHVGNTDFATHLVAEIADGISSGMTTQQAPTMTAPRPNCYPDLKNAQTVDDLERIIAGLTERERSQSLVYALYERADNRVIIEHLAQYVNTFNPEDAGKLANLAVGQLLDLDNVNALFATSTPVSIIAQNMLSPLMATA